MQQRLLCTILVAGAWQPPRTVRRPTILRAAPTVRRPTRLRATLTEAEGVRRGLESVVCVFSTTAAPDYGQPWAVYSEEDVTGSGFWVSSTQVVTNEHVIKHARDIRVRPHGSARKLKCRVAFASAERDLALLEVTDDAMSPAPLTFAQSLPELYSAVAVVGYPLGGDNICVTRGVVSRVDAMSYGGGGRGERLLVVQIDAGVNSGTSGGPALDERGHVAGVAFSSYAGSADNIGYLVPASVVEKFLEEATLSARCPGLCALGISWQTAQNKALRRSLGLQGTEGVLVTRASGSSKGVLEPGDVVSSVGGSPVAEDGSIQLRGAERIPVAHAITSKRVGDVVDVGFVRAGAPRVAQVTLAAPVRPVPCVAEWDASPSYCILGGLVLQPLSAPLWDAFDEEDAGYEDPGDIAARYGANSSEVLLWTSTLTSDANYGYSELSARLPRLIMACGTTVEGLAHAATVCREARERGDAFYDLRFRDPGASDEVRVVLDIDEVDDTDLELLERYSIPDLASKDVADAYWGPEPPQPKAPARRRSKKRRR